MSTTQPVHDPYAPWRDRNYRLYSTGWMAQTIAFQIESVAIGVHIYDRTADPLALGWVGLVRALPIMLLSIAGGQLADRYNRRSIMLMTQTLTALASGGLLTAAYYGSPIHWFYVFLFLGAIGQAFGTPARAALLPQLLPVEIFSNAMVWNSSLFQVSTIVGPAIGGFMLGQHNYTPPALTVVLLLRLASIVPIAMLRVPPMVKKTTEISMKSLLAGIRFVRESKVILATLTLDLAAVLVGGATYLLPIFAMDILHVGGRGLGLLRSAEAVGAICMAMTIAHRPPFKRSGRAMLWAVAGFGLATIVFGLSPWFGLSLAAMFLIGAFDNISVIVRHTLVQVLTPDSMRGRVSAVNNVFIVASNDLGGFESGVTARVFGDMASGFGWASPGLSGRIVGAVSSVVFGGVGAILAVIGTAKIWPEVHKLGSLRDIRPIADTSAPQQEKVNEQQ